MSNNSPLTHKKKKIMLNFVALNILVSLILFTSAIVAFVLIIQNYTTDIEYELAQKNIEIMNIKHNLWEKDTQINNNINNHKVVYFDENNVIIESQKYGYFGENIPQKFELYEDKITINKKIFIAIAFQISTPNEINASKGIYLYDTTKIRLQYYDKYVLTTIIIGAFVIILLVIVDIVGWKSIMNLEKENSARNQELMSDITHEFNTPLTIISTSLTNALSQPNARVNQISDNLSKSLDSVNSLRRMVKDMSLLSKFDMDKLVVEYSYCDVSAIIKDVVEPFQIMAEYSEKDFVAKIDENINIYTDSDKIRQLAIILLDNANKYTKVSEKIEVELIDCYTKIILRVSDTGIGMETQNMKKAFDRFYREDRARNNDNKMGGTGLGLPIAKAVVEALGGKIRVYHNEPKGFVAEIEIKK